MRELIEFEDFDSVDIRIGTITSVANFESAKKPAYQIVIDFGSLGKLRSSAQITELYKTDDLVGRQIIAIVNVGHKQISNFISQCLILGVSTKSGVSLLHTNFNSQNGIIVT